MKKKTEKEIEGNPPRIELPIEAPTIENLPDITPIQEITRAEIDMQITTAKKYPRSLRRFRQEALTLATSDVDIASQCFYVLQRKSAEGTIKKIEGASVRLAEISANAWGNVRFGARIVGEDAKSVTAQGVCHDLEKNVSNTIEVSRRITNKYGVRFSDDMVQVTKNAACSIALRNAIFKTIPFAYIKPIYEMAKKTAVGGSKTIKERRAAMIKTFTDMGVPIEKLIDFIQKPSIEDIGLSDIETLIGIYTAIKDGETTIYETFGGKKGKGDVEIPKEKAETPDENMPEFGS